ncbi:MAG: hypothetical protein ABI040_08025 [Rhodoferax sp.]
MKTKKMSHSIFKGALALALMGAGLAVLSQLVAAVLGWPLPEPVLLLTDFVLFAAILSVLRRQKRRTKRKYRDMQDSALW